jgi:hypothetical protein
MNPEMTEAASKDGPEHGATAPSRKIPRRLEAWGKTTQGTILDRPGPLEGSWERWFFAAGSALPERLEPDAPISSGREIVTALPSSRLFSWPLWISSEGDPVDLARMELSGRHFLKRGMENSLTVLPVAQVGGRRLVMAVASEEPFAEESMLPGWRESSRFQFPCNVFGDMHGHDLLLWQEWGTLRMAFYREGKPVWFCGLEVRDAGGGVQRSALRLLSEKVIEQLPLSIAIHGMPPGSADLCSRQLQHVFPRARIHSDAGINESGSPALPQPLRPDSTVDIPPSEAVAERRRKGRLRRILNFAAAASILYILLILWGAGDLLIRRMAWKRQLKEAASLSAPALLAKGQSERWKAARPAVDPFTYPLDLLAAAAVPTESGKVRLTGFTLDQDRLQISGEATDVTQAYAFIEQLKKNPLLQEYEWTAGQPQLAGKNSVRFEMDGARNPSKP